MAVDIAMADVYTEGFHRRQVVTSLDAFGEQPRADPATERHERFDQCLLRVVAGDPVGDVAIDLDDCRLERRDEREARVARTGVIDGKAETEAPHRLALAGERADVR